MFALQVLVLSVRHPARLARYVRDKSASFPLERFATLFPGVDLEHAVTRLNRIYRGVGLMIAVVGAALLGWFYVEMRDGDWSIEGIVVDEHVHHLVSHNGILGAAPRIAEFDYAWPPNAALVMHSDGLSSRWQLSRWGRVWQRHPALIAGVAYRDLARGTDDAVVVVASEHAVAA